MTGKGTLLLGVGPGRSGTSLAAVALQQLGAHVPKPQLRPNDMNPSGFGEARFPIRLNKKILGDAEVLYVDARPSAPSELLGFVFAGEPLMLALEWLVGRHDHRDTVILKDPRLPWTLDMWTEVAALSGRSAVLLRMVREPQSVVASILRWSSRNRTPEYLLGGWINLNRNIDLYHGQLPLYILEHDKLVRDLEPYITSLVNSMQSEGFALGLNPGRRSLSHLIDPNRSHSSGSSNRGGVDADSKLAHIADAVYQSLLSEGAGQQLPEVALAQRRELYAEYDQLYGSGERLLHRSQQVVVRGERAKSRAQEYALRERDQRIAQLEQQVATLSNAPSRWSARIRSIARLVLRPVKAVAPRQYGKLRARLVASRGGARS